VEDNSDSPRVEDPTDGVVDGLARRESLMSALVGDNPKTGSRKTDAETVESPQTELGHSVPCWARESDEFGGDEGVQLVEEKDEGRDNDNIHHDVRAGANSASLEAVGTEYRTLDQYSNGR
jgi:hypothetical protein